MKITLTNSYHNSEVTLTSKDGSLSEGQVRKAHSSLCGSSDCTCGDFLGTRDCNHGLTPIYDNYTGRIIGAEPDMQ